MWERQIQAAQQIGIHRKETAGEPDHDSDRQKATRKRGGFEAFAPERRRQNREADEGEHVPVRRSLVIDGKQQVKREDRHAEPEKIQDLELLPGPAPVRDNCPRQRQKEQRRESEKMTAEKPAQ